LQKAYEMENNIHILCTRELDPMLVEAAAEKNITIDIRPFIATEPIETVEVQQEIENALLLSTTIVFTSMNAVEAVATFIIDDQPDWRIYCIGHTTRKLAERFFGENCIAGFAEDATALAELIVEEGETEELIFFCGNKRRNELPDILRSNDIIIEEIIVYETFEVNHKVSGEYNAVLFFSPSAVESFFVNNKPNDKIIFFAIGKTTAAAIKKFSTNKIIIADEPGKENLVEKMMEYFSG
jgi:uroporphyrinogen-III synthase